MNIPMKKYESSTIENLISKFVDNSEKLKITELSQFDNQTKKEIIIQYKIKNLISKFNLRNKIPENLKDKIIQHLKIR